MRTKQGEKKIYYLKKLILGSEVQPGVEGYFAAVPEEGFTGHTFKILHLFEKIGGEEIGYGMIEKVVPDWTKAEFFRKFDDKFGREDGYTLGYFKMCSKLPENYGNI